MPIVSCKDGGWGFELFHHLKEGHEVDLSDVDLAVHGHFCQGLARKHNMLVCYDFGHQAMRFFKPLSAGDAL